jgi:hypothetical protein
VPGGIVKRVWITVSFPLPASVSFKKAHAYYVPKIIDFVSELTGTSPRYVKTEMR